MKFLSEQRQGSLYAIGSGLCYGLIGYFGVTVMNAGLSLSNMMFWRFLIASIFMGVILIPSYKSVFKSWTENVKIILYGMAFYGPSAIVYFMSSRYVGTGLAMVIFFVYPAMVMLVNVFYYKMVLKKMDYIAFSLVALGMLCLVDMKELTFDILGICFGVLSAVLYACYIVASKKSKIPPNVSTFMVSFGCMITSLIVCLVDGTFEVPQTLGLWSNITSMSIVCTTLPILMFLQSLKYISSEKASMLSVLEPVFVVILGVALLGEHVTILQAIGAVVILSGAAMTFMPHKVQYSVK